MQRILQGARRGGVLFIWVGTLLFFGAVFAHRAGDFPVADEVDFIRPLLKWVSDGPNVNGLWHSPFYPWFISLLGKAFGSLSYSVARSIGAVTAIASMLFMYFAAIKVRPLLSGWRHWVLIALALLGPVSLGPALLLDYDTTLLVASTSLYFLLLALFPRSRAPLAKWLLAFSAALALCFASKETTPFVYPIGIFVLLYRRLGFLKAVLAASVVLIAGFGLFLFVTWIWCWFYQLPLSAVFQMDLLGLRVHAGVPQPWAVKSTLNQIWIKTMPAFWLGLPLTFWALLALPRILVLGLRKPDRGTEDKTGFAAIAAVIIAVIFGYTFALRQMTYHFPKYMAPVLPWITWLLIVREPVSLIKNQLERRRYIIWALFVALAFSVMKSPLNIAYNRTPSSLIIAAWPLLFFVLNQLGKPWRINQGSLLIFVTVGLALKYSVGLLISPGSPHYWYAEHTLSESVLIAKEWKLQNPSGQVYSPAKDIAFATRDTGSLLRNKDEMIGISKLLCSSSEPWIVITRKREDSSLVRAPELELLLKCKKEFWEGRDTVAASNTPITHK